MNNKRRMRHRPAGQSNASASWQDQAADKGKKDLPDYLLPRRARELARAVLSSPPTGEQKSIPAKEWASNVNFGLRLHKYIQSGVLGLSQSPPAITRPQWLQELAEGYTLNTELAAAIYQRWQRRTSALGAVHFQASVDWRMVVGLGGNTALETDLTLHHLYGLPIIPGSALKGLTRACIESQPPSTRPFSPDRICGTTEQAGSVIFFDALPLDGVARLQLDVMTPHYPDYYRGEKPPTNDQQPIPITFLTVAETTFAFALAPRTPATASDEIRYARKCLEAALQAYGVGGKTSAGYGYFRALKELPSSVSEQAGSQGQEVADPEALGKARAMAEELAQLSPGDLQRKNAEELINKLVQLSSSPFAQCWLAQRIIELYRQNVSPQYLKEKRTKLWTILQNICGDDQPL